MATKTTTPVPEQFSHLLADGQVEVHYGERPQATLHRVGCSHRGRRGVEVGSTFDAATLFEDTTTKYRDDYFHVAPCARRARG